MARGAAITKSEVRGTFAHSSLRNQSLRNRRGWTLYCRAANNPVDSTMARRKISREGRGSFAGDCGENEYGSGYSRDWQLQDAPLGAPRCIAESYEPYRSNLIAWA